MIGLFLFATIADQQQISQGEITARIQRVRTVWQLRLRRTDNPQKGQFSDHILATALKNWYKNWGQDIYGNELGQSVIEKLYILFLIGHESCAFLILPFSSTVCTPPHHNSSGSRGTGYQAVLTENKFVAFLNDNSLVYKVLPFVCKMLLDSFCN